MAGEDIIPGGINTASMMSGLGSITTAVFWIVVVLAVGGVIFFIWWYLSFKFNVVIREIVNNKTLIKKDKAKLVKTKGGVLFWKLRGYNVRIPEPPSQAIDVDHKGRKWVEFYKKSDGSFVPICDEYTEEKFMKDFPQFKPFTTEQRALLVHEAEEAEKYKKKGIGELLMALAPYIAIVLILLVFMIFFNDVVAPTVAFGNQLASSSKVLADAVNILSGQLSNTTSVSIEYRARAPGTG